MNKHTTKVSSVADRLDTPPSAAAFKPLNLLVHGGGIEPPTHGEPSGYSTLPNQSVGCLADAKPVTAFRRNPSICVRRV